MLNSPEATEVVAAVGEYARYRSTLDPVVREIAVLSTAREHGNEYEWAHHEPLARKAGVSDAAIEAIRIKAYLRRDGGETAAVSGPSGSGAYRRAPRSDC